MPRDDTIALTLYQRVLGPQFESLPAVLSTFHSSRSGGTATGTMDIVRGEGLIRNFMASLLGLPPAGKKVPVTLAVRADDAGETWERSFGSHRMITSQWFDRCWFVERAGPLDLWFRVEASEAGMRCVSFRCVVFGILMPKPVALHVIANIIGSTAGWWVDVEIRAPLIGALVRYEGEMIPS